MPFNSVEFAIFLPIVFLLYWFVTNRSLKLQNLFLLASSYFFYGCWDWRFLSLIFLSTIVDYIIGLSLEKEENQNRRKLLLLFSLTFNLGILAFFKYYNFFLENFISAFTLFGHDLRLNSLNIILPVGISFYTFQTLSYTIDIYKQKVRPTKEFIEFAAYVSFFPQLVAGPIERAANFLPQFSKARNFNYARATDGMRQILWGLFKKIVIADNCAEYADLFFNNSSDYSGSSLLIGAVFFSFQVYGDFSGYSDIAIGTAHLLGFDLKQNFNFPYFSRDIAEFWRRWHISLSTWFRDYVYIPLGGSRGSKWKQVRNVFVIFIISGFWHGANWTFIAWGVLNAFYFLPLLLLRRHRANLDVLSHEGLLPSFKTIVSILFTFGLTVLGWIFFRAESISHALMYFTEIFSSSLWTVPEFVGRKKALAVLGLVTLFMIVEWNGKMEQYGIAKFGNSWPRPVRWAFYYIIIITIFCFCGKEQEFVYFQF